MTLGPIQYAQNRATSAVGKLEDQSTNNSFQAKLDQLCTREVTQELVLNSQGNSETVFLAL